MSARCAATATPSPICSKGGGTHASGISERGQHAVAGKASEFHVDCLRLKVRPPESGCGSENGEPGPRDTFGLDVAGDLAQTLTIAVGLHRDREFAVGDYAAIT